MSDANDRRDHVALLRRLRDQHDREAWNIFVDRYTTRIYDWCRRHELSESDAALATQEVMRQLLLAVRHHKYDPSKSGYRDWLKVVTAKTVRKLLHPSDPRRGGSDDAPALAALSTIKDSTADTDLIKQIDEAYEKELLREAALRVQRQAAPQTWQAYRRAAIEKVPPAAVALQFGLTDEEVGAAKIRVVKMLRAEMKKLDAM